MPTPVSALIHAATLVTAGVYLLLRSSPVIEYGPTTLIVITWVGALTAFFAASTGLLQNDLKRVIAYSTCSQMGYLFMACGLSQYNVALFHLVNHAFFKALLFLAAGAVLHATYDQQDQRRLGGLIGFLPFTYTAILIGSLSLMALPWLTGFYSKDLILEVAYGQYEFSGQVAYWLGTLSACLTAFYSLRLISLTFLTYPNASKSVYLHTHDAPTIVMIPLIILSLLAIFFGYIARDLFVGMGSDFLSPSLFTHPSHISLIEAEFSLPQIIKLLPAIGTLLGAGLALYLYHMLPVFTIDLTNTTLGQKLYRFFNGKYYVDVIYNHYIINGGLQLGYVISKVLDRGIIELVGPYGLATGLSSGSKDIAKLDTGNLTSYALYLAIALVTLIMILLSPVLLNAALINGPLILVLLVGMVCLPYITSTTDSSSGPLYSKKKSVPLLSFMFPFLLIYPNIDTTIPYLEDLVVTCCIISLVFIASKNNLETYVSFITSIKYKIYFTMLQLVMSPIFRFFILVIVSMLINIFFVADSVYCAEDTITNSASTSTAATISTDPTVVRPINLEHNENGMVDFAAKNVSAATDAAIRAAPWDTIAGASSTVKTTIEVFKATPGSPLTKSIVGLSMGFATGGFVYAIGRGDSTLKPVTPKRGDVDKHNQFVPCPLEEGDSKLNFLESIYQFLVNWMSSSADGLARLYNGPGLDIISNMSANFSFSSFNLLVYLMTTVACYFVFFGFTLFSLHYFNNTSTSKLVKSNPVSSVIVEYFTRLIQNIIGINKAILMFLFAIILVCSTLLYIYYEITPDIATKFYHNVVQKVYNGQTHIILKYLYYNVAIETFQKASLVISAVVLSLYRWSITKQLLKDYPYTKIPFAFVIVSTMQISTNFILSIVAVENATFIQILTTLNMCTKLVFYSLTFILISVTIQYILYNNPSTKGKVNNSSHSSYLYYNITIIVLKIITSVALMCASQGILYLYTHYIPGDLHYLCTLYSR